MNTLTKTTTTGTGEPIETTALIQAVYNNHPKAVNLLLDHKAAIDALDTSGSSAFHMACVTGRTDCAVALVKAGCDTSIQAIRGSTGWDMAEKQGHMMLIRRCRLAKRQRKAQNTSKDTVTEEASSTFASDAEEQDRLQKAAKKREANRKKKERRKRNKATASLAEPEPELEPAADAIPAPKFTPKDENTCC